MTHLTLHDYAEKGVNKRSFICKSCGGFKYLQVPRFDYTDTAICEDCYQTPSEQAATWNYGGSSPKPGFHEVLVNMWKEYGDHRDKLED